MTIILLFPDTCYRETAKLAFPINQIIFHYNVSFTVYYFAPAFRTICILSWVPWNIAYHWIV